MLIPLRRETDSIVRLLFNLSDFSNSVSSFIKRTPVYREVWMKAFASRFRTHSSNFRFTSFW